MFNRDGGTIHSEFAAPGDTLGWDERHTIVTPDGERIRFERSGDTQTITDANTGAVLGRSTWTADGPQSEATVQPAFVGPAGPAIQSALMLYTWLSGKNDANGTAVFAFKADEYKPEEGPDPKATWVGRLTREETDAACPRHGEVQDRTDAAAELARREGNYLTASQYGTRVHTNLKYQIDALGDRNFVAERSYIKSEVEKYGTRGSIRVDVFENVGNGTVCVYDIKTGSSGLTLGRSAEIAGAVITHYGPGQRTIVIETRPRR